jgi:hypothetical protein
VLSRTLRLLATDVDHRPLVDPTVFVRLASPDNRRAAAKRLALNGVPALLRFADGPPGFALLLRVSPSRYRDGLVTAAVDGDGRVTPTQAIRLPRKPSEWLPAFTPWSRLSGVFAPLQRVLERSPAFRVGRTSAPELFVRTSYDAVERRDESRALAKMCLLNLYGRLREEPVPHTGQPWFALVQELFLATRERLVARVDRTCWDAIRQLEQRPMEGYWRAPVGDHRANLEAVAGVSQVRDLASVKTREAKANLQFTVARARRDGVWISLLDADIDEHGTLLPHVFDLIAHAFTGGTHPLDVHESIRAARPDLDVGYALRPREPLAVTSGRRAIVVAGAASPAERSRAGSRRSRPPKRRRHGS